MAHVENTFSMRRKLLTRADKLTRETKMTLPKQPQQPQQPLVVKGSRDEFLEFRDLLLLERECYSGGN